MDIIEVRFGLISRLHRIKRKWRQSHLGTYSHCRSFTHPHTVLTTTTNLLKVASAVVHWGLVLRSFTSRFISTFLLFNLNYYVECAFSSRKVKHSAGLFGLLLIICVLAGCSQDINPHKKIYIYIFHN